MKVHIVIPIGVSTPGTPVMKLLETSVKSVLDQSFRDFKLTVAADTNIPDDRKEFLESLGVEIKWFEPASFFRKGGIWKKITETWKMTDSEYLAFLHYDDLWDREKLFHQVNLMDEKNLNSSWSETYVIDGESRIVSGDTASWYQFSAGTVGYRTVALAHSSMVRREQFFSSGIMEYEDTWSPVFEDLFVLYMQRLGKGQKAVGSKFFWRNHEMNMSNSILSDPKWKDVMESQRAVGEYSNDEVEQDIKTMHDAMRRIAQETQTMYLNGEI